MVAATWFTEFSAAANFWALSDIASPIMVQTAFHLALAEAASRLTQRQKTRLLSAFLSLLGIGVGLVLIAYWMARRMRRYMNHAPPDTPTPLPDDVLRMHGVQACDEDPPDHGES